MAFSNADSEIAEVLNMFLSVFQSVVSSLHDH